MTIEQIQSGLALMNNGPAPKKPAKKKPAVVPVAINPDDMLAINAARIVAAFDMTNRAGATAATLVAGVKQYEASCAGMVQ